MGVGVLVVVLMPLKAVGLLSLMMVSHQPMETKVLTLGYRLPVVRRDALRVLAGMVEDHACWPWASHNLPDPDVGILASVDGPTLALTDSECSLPAPALIQVAWPDDTVEDGLVLLNRIHTVTPALEAQLLPGRVEHRPRTGVVSIDVTPRPTPAVRTDFGPASTST